MTEKHQLTVRPMSEQDGQYICTWHYESPYHCYNWPNWEYMKQHELEFADPTIRNQQYFSVYDVHNQVIAFFQLFPLLDTIRLGLFVHPLLVNQGIGKSVCNLAVQTAKQKFTQPYIDLEVSTWNKRAINVYEQCGFRTEDEYELFNRTTQKHELVYNMVYKTPSAQD